LNFLIEKAPFIENWRFWPDYDQELTRGARGTGARNWDSFVGLLSARNF
jgi:hypothetical protein